MTPSKSLGRRGFHDTFKWHLYTNYNDAFLLNEGFSYCKRSTIEAVEDGKGRYDIKNIFWFEPSVDGSAMLALGDYDFGAKKVTKRPRKNAAGESRVKERGDKTMSGEMLAYGSWDAFGNQGQGLGTDKKEVRVYNPNAKIDPHLNTLLTSHVDQLTAAESDMVPSCAEARRFIANQHDPSKRHRITFQCDAFSCTISINYVTDPHDDSGAHGVLEFIQFVNATGPLPAGHKWLFVVGGCIYELPTKRGESCIIALPACGVYHGTLPTSSTTDTHPHGNYGSALITKADILKGLTRHLSLGTQPSAQYSSSKLYFGAMPAVASLSLPRTQTSAPPVSSSRTIAHAFWAPSVQGVAPTLPSYALHGLKTAVANFDKVYLWQYEDVTNAPAGLIKCDASTLLTVGEKDALLSQNVTIAHVADVVRFRAAATKGGWVIDADNLWLRNPPSGFVFTTLWAKRTGGVAPSSSKWQTMKAAFAKDGWDGGDSTNTPFSVVPGTPFAAELLSSTNTFVTKQTQGEPRWEKPPTKAQWNSLMCVLRDLIVKHNLGKYVRPPIEYGVSPYWHGFTDKILEDGFFDLPAPQRVKFGVQLPSTTEVLKDAICVPTSFILADRHGKYSGLKLRDLLRAHPTSLLGRVIVNACPWIAQKRKTCESLAPVENTVQTTQPTPCLQKRQKVGGQAIPDLVGKRVMATIPKGRLMGTYKATVVEMMWGGLGEEDMAGLEFEEAGISIPKWFSPSSLRVI